MGKMFCRLALVSKKKKSGAVPVYLNVYDLTPINGYAYWFGLGVYHSGVQGEKIYGDFCLRFLFLQREAEKSMATMRTRVHFKRFFHIDQGIFEL